MNLCNFAKVIIARATKDNTALHFWQHGEFPEITISDPDNKKNPECPEPPSNLENTSPTPSENEKSKKITITVPKYNTNFNVASRCQTYNKIMHNQNQMQCDATRFRSILPRVQSYITENKKWKNGNTAGEKQAFLDKFSLYEWLKLKDSQKAKHTFRNCEPCMYEEVAQNHQSSEHVEKNTLVGACQSVTKILQERSPPNTKTAEKQVENFIKIFSPLASEKLGVDLKKPVSKVLKLTPKISKLEKRKSETSLMRKNNVKIKSNMVSNGEDVKHFLKAGKSFRKHEIDRISTFFISKKEAQEKLKIKLDKLNKNKIKEKNHYGNFDQYTFDKNAFLLQLRETREGERVNWRRLGEQFDVKNKRGERPANAGQILLEYAKAKGINTDSFNTGMRVSKRDNSQRLRRAKKIVAKGLTMPTPRSAKSFKTEIKRRIETGEFKIGEKIVPKVISSTKIDKTGR